MYAWNHSWKFDVHAILINNFETSTKNNPKVTHIMDYLPVNSFLEAAPALQKHNKKSPCW